MATVAKLTVNETSFGAISPRAANIAGVPEPTSAGRWTSMISSVTTIAKTPSLNASRRPVPSTSGRAPCGLCSGRGVTERSSLVGVCLGGVDGGREIRTSHAAGLLALRPVELLVDLVLGVAAFQQRRLGGQDHVRVAADVRDRVGGRETKLVQDGTQD